MWLLDTHLLLWAAYAPERLSRRASQLLQQRDSRLVFSLASIWEVVIKASLRRADFTADAIALQRAFIGEGYVKLPISPAHIAQVATLPWLHRDPFDRMLVALAAAEGMTLLTADAALKPYGRFVRVV